MRFAIVAAFVAFLSFALPSRSAMAQQRDPTRRDLGTYQLRVEDEIEIVVMKPGEIEPVLQRKITIPGNGVISFPPVGKVELLGKTVFDVEATIAQRLKDENFLLTPNVGCVVTKYAPRTVSVIGPSIQGTIELPIHRNIRILELLAMSGALGQEGADIANVTIRRIGADGLPFRIPVNVEDILQRNQEDKNVVIFEGDIVSIPRLEAASPLAADWVYVLGKVRNPGRHPIVKGKTPFTLTKLIAIVGDFQEFANRTQVKIIRTTETGRVPFEIDFDDIIEGDRPDFELRPDDLVYVPESFF